MNNDQYNIRVLLEGETRTIKGDIGSTLMDIFHDNNIYIEAPCGGKGICGKCKVKIIDGDVSDITSVESKFLSHSEKKEGYRLACMTKVLGDIEVSIKNHLEGAQILSTGVEYIVDISPHLSKKFLQLDQPTVDNQKDDLARLGHAIGMPNPEIDIALVRQISRILRDSNFDVTLVHDQDRILNVEKGDTTEHSYGIAIDIGTTTVVCYLMNLNTGKQVDIISGLNVQKTYGGDVISRIQYTMERSDGLSRLRKGIVDQISELMEQLVHKNNISIDYVYDVVIAGNTIMGHLLLGLPCENIAASPFIPVCTEAMIYSAHELGIKAGMGCRVFILPHISGYVGSDVVAGILSTGMDSSEDLSLIIDIGTNGEIALGDKDGLVCCSTAAGPAFEGANIRHGMGGVSGAINTIMLDEEDIKYTTINNIKPMGICGSGIVDALAVLLDGGIVDETGRIVDEDELETEIGRKLANRLVDMDGEVTFIIAYGEDTYNGEPIVMTQKDVREIQLAKAAIAAGVKVLVNKMGKKVDDIVHLYLAGGFGSYIDKRNASRIGLIPSELEGRILAIGNGAGTGAILSLLSIDKYNRASTIKGMAKYVELSSTVEFQTEYVDCMYFEE
ncbi:MAG TPA: ASKHA domain-containing protein [Clostridia bacterium]|nr:ASKHA domain-containing protein [Clostridia bacterium]